MLLPLLAFLLSYSPAHAAFCGEWSESTQLGTLPQKPLSEASGVAVSKRFPNRIYWVNDSDDKQRFYYSQVNGEKLITVRVPALQPRDTEALAMADCPEGTCLVIGDIGDNLRIRKNITVHFILEQAEFPTETPILRSVSLRFPDGARDAEAMGILPNGDLILITKDLRLPTLSVSSAGVYTLPAAQLHDKNLIQPLTLKKLGELPLQNWAAEDGMLGQVVTDLAINTERNVLGLLTYANVLEIPLTHLAQLEKTASWTRGKQFQIVPIKALKQQETMAYLSAPDRLLWSTEYMPPNSPIFSMTCKRAMP